MNALCLVFLGLLGIASAQYSCAPGFCSQNNGLDRADVLGCLYFCYLDVTPDESLERDEFHTRYTEWLGGAADCDLTCFLTAHTPIIPACESELTGAFNLLAILDGDGATVSHADIDSWVDQLVAIQGSEPILAAAFQTWFRGVYDRIVDPTCTLPYP